MNKIRKSDKLRLQKAKLARRAAYAKIKANPVLYEIEKEKEKKRYRKRKENKQLIPIHEMDPKEQRAQRRKWREATKRHRERKKEDQIQTIYLPETPNIVTDDIPDNDYVDDVDHNMICKDSKCSIKQKYLCDCSSKIHLIRVNELKKRIRLKRIIKTQQAEIKRLKEMVTRQILEIKNVENTMPNKEENVTPAIIDINNTIGITKETAKLLELFYEEHSNGHSVAIGGKNEFITKNEICKQKRYLTSSLNVLYEKFLKESKIKISYSTFCLYRPFWVLTPKHDETYICIVHENIELIIKALYEMKIIKEKNSKQLLDKICCSSFNEKCLLRECLDCKSKTVDYNYVSDNETIKYYKWIHIKENLSTKSDFKPKTITKKVEIITKSLDLLKTFGNHLTLFMKHISKIHIQNLAMKELKKSLTVNEVIINVNFSENYRSICDSEIQSGDRRKDLCLHTADFYTFDFQTSTVGTFSACTVSECLRNDAAAIWAHLTPLIKKILQQNSFVDTIHFQSDIRASHYRNKYMFYVISRLCNDFQQICKVTWNYLESNRKGNPYEIATVIKKCADLHVISNVNNFDKIVFALQKSVKNVIVIPITEEDINSKEILMPNNLITFSNTLDVHQVLWQKNLDYLTFRSASCFKCDTDNICTHGRHMEFQKLPSQTETLEIIDIGNIIIRPSINTTVGTVPNSTERNPKIDMKKILDLFKVKLVTNKKVTVLGKA